MNLSKTEINSKPQCTDTEKKCLNTKNFLLKPIFSHLNQYLSVFSVLDCIVASLVSWIALLHPLVNPAPLAIYIF